MAEACLVLQDGLGIDVTIMLFALWCGAERGIPIGEHELGMAEDIVDPWHREVVGALRILRRRMKHGGYMDWAPATHALRARIKAAELEAERIELARLEKFGEALAEAGARSAQTASDNLERLLRRSGADDDARWSAARSTILRQLDGMLAGVDVPIAE